MFPAQKSSNDNYVYDPRLFSKVYMPYCIYIPNDFVLLKIMRACVFCRSFDETIFGIMEK